MVENSLGRLWLEGHPDVKEQLLPTEEEQSAYAAGNRDPEDTKWHYYLEEAEQEPEVQAQLAEIRKEYAALTPDQLKVIDPCSGSGHILAYMFDVLMKIYESYGYTTREAVASIVENNLYGLDIDDRAAQLAYFAVMMKARQYDRRFFSRGIQPHVYAIVESNHVDKFVVDYFGNGDMKLTAAMEAIISELHDAKEYGSILTVTPQDWSELYDRFAEITEDINMSRDTALRELLPLVQVAEALAQKYALVITNPPYMGSNNMSAKLNNFIKKNFPDSKSDMFAVFIEKCGEMLMKNGYQAMITQQGWMFVTSFEKLREKLLRKDLTSMVHLGSRAFDEISGEVVQTTSFIFANQHILDYKGVYARLISGNSEREKDIMFLNKKYHYYSKTDDFEQLPGMPFAYWVGNGFMDAFKKFPRLGDFVECAAGISTGDNDKYLKLWTEVDDNTIAKGIFSDDDFKKSQFKYAYCNKGGGFRKWYGNNEYVADWRNSGKFHRNGATYRHLLFIEGITWSEICMGNFGARYYPNGQIFDHKSPGLFTNTHENLMVYIGFLNSKVVAYILGVINPTISTGADSLRKIPLAKNSLMETGIAQIAEKQIESSKIDWDSFETSWDFQHHPLLQKVPTIAEAFEQWQTECNDRFNQLKANEEELNRIFIDIYGLQDELTPEVEDKDVTVRKADLGRDIRSFISYAVGCMLGRYSLDVDGLAYAGGEWDASKYASFAADKDNIIPICDDEYFEDDIVGLFVKFVKTIYGADTLDENLKFIADALGGKGQPKDVIRNYFLSDFYSDHCKIYQKRPIYWLFDSGKKNGFKALIYMHRYQPDTIASIRTDYVHEQQARYRTAIADLEKRIEGASTSERVKLNKKLTVLQAQDAEIGIYEEKIHHLADQMISIDLDDGVKHNYAIFQDVLAKIK